MTDVISALMHWYRSQCDGIWEEDSGVKIDTLDNPGWTITVDLKTKPADKIQERVERSEEDWVFWWVEDGQWRAACGPLNLKEALEIFLNFVEEEPTSAR